MLILPSEDLSEYKDEHGEFTADGAARLRADTDRFYEEGAENKSAIYTAVCVVKGRINEKLQERSRKAYDELVAYCNTEEFRNVLGYDSELYYFAETIPIYMMECEKGGEEGITGRSAGDSNLVVYDCINYINDFHSLYMTLLFYFRRMQMGFTGPDILGLFSYIREKGLSVFLIAQLLCDMPVGNKDRVTIAVADMYWSVGRKNEALFITAFLEQHTEDEVRDAIAAKRAALVAKFV